uniref:Uracil-DNA glycosylase-like domain-containing protein n=1 Tax=Physcomitrium patens TaxID=3218 RepID=A0A7I4BM22_PHYPA
MADELNEIITIPKREINNGIIIFRALNDVLRAFYETPLSDANGLSFSINKDYLVPPSLTNIFKQISDEIRSFNIPPHSDLTKWCKQGVLLLNSELTTESGSSRSHDVLWQRFTKTCIRLCSIKERVIFVLWEKTASTFDKEIDTSRNTILKAAHPSPFSANKGFFGCNYFTIINDLLDTPIDWNL